MASHTNTDVSPATKPLPSEKMTYEEFLDWADEDTHAEWVGGEVVLMSPVSDKHQNIADFLTSLLRIFAEAHHAGTVRSAPFQIKLGPDLPGREPDILFLAGAHHDRLTPTYLDGPADLVVEIIGPESRARDRGEKFYEYEQAKIREYWLLDPIRRRAEFYLLDENGVYRPATVGDDHIFYSSVLDGLWIDVDWLWKDPMPPLMSVLKKWDLV